MRRGGRRGGNKKHISTIEVGSLTGIAFPVEIFLWIAVAFQPQSVLFAGGAVREGVMIIRNVIEEVDLSLVQQQTCRDRVDRSVTPPLVVETPSLVEEVEIIEIGLRT